MTRQEAAEKAKKYLIMQTGMDQPIVDHADGVYVYDTEGKKYLDFIAGIAVLSTGYNNPHIMEALKNQLATGVTHTTGMYNENQLRAAERLVTKSKLSKVFFCNSGAEAVEGCIKLAKKYYYKKTGRYDAEIIAMNHSFHGRTSGAVSVTGNPHYQEGFVPDNFKAIFAEFNNLEDVKKKITPKTAAIITEIVQGEGGIHPIEEEFIKGLRKICDENDIILIFDEVQCGMGRTGYLFAHDRFGVKPDCMSMAKALGGGIPVGAFLAGPKLADTFVRGDHGTTFGGNPFSMAAVNAVLDVFEEKNLPEHANEMGEYLDSKIVELMKKYPIIIDHRGLGLMRAAEFTIPVADIIAKAKEKGLLLIAAGEKVIRFSSPLIIEKEHIDEMISILDSVLAETSEN